MTEPLMGDLLQRLEVELAKAEKAMVSIVPSAVKDIRALFEDHYWDSLEDRKDIVMKHINSVLDMYDRTATATISATLAAAKDRS